MDIDKVIQILSEALDEKDWDLIKEGITYDFIEDNHFSELKDLEILGERIDHLDRLGDYIGKYYSTEWVRRNVLRQSEREIQELDKQIEAEKESGEDGEEDSFL